MIFLLNYNNCFFRLIQVKIVLAELMIGGVNNE